MAVRVGGIVRQTSTKQSKELVQEELPPLKEPQPQQKEATKIHAQKIETARREAKKNVLMDHASNAGTTVTAPRRIKRNVLGKKFA